MKEVEPPARHRPNWHWFDLFLIAAPVTLTVLTLRGLGLLPPWVGLHDKVVIAARSLEAGQVIEKADLGLAELKGGDHFFVAISDAQGSTLVHKLSAGRPLRYEDVLRPQVVALTDLPVDTVVGPHMATVASSTYQRDAALQMEQVVGKMTRRSVGKGEVVLFDYLKPSATGGDLPGRRTLCLRVAAHPAVQMLTTPAHVSLVLSPRSGVGRASSSVVLQDVILLSVEGGGECTVITVAVTPHDLAMAAPRLGASDVFVVQSKRG